MEKITVKSDCKKLTAEGGVVSCLKARTTEVAATREKFRLSSYAVRIVNLDRVAACPRCYPDVEEKPRAAIYGLARLRWIASRMNTTVGEIRRLLPLIDRALAND